MNEDDHKISNLVVGFSKIWVVYIKLASSRLNFAIAIKENRVNFIT